MEKLSIESLAAAKVCREMEKPEIIKSMGFLSTLEFLVGHLKESKASDSSVVKSIIQWGKISKKLNHLKETQNNIAEILLNNLQDLTVKKVRI